MKELRPAQSAFIGLVFGVMFTGFIVACSPPGPAAKAEAQGSRDLTPRHQPAATSYICVMRAGSGWIVLDQFEGGVAFVPSSAGWDGILRER